MGRMEILSFHIARCTLMDKKQEPIWRPFLDLSEHNMYFV
jgi:hypothetical protein